MDLRKERTLKLLSESLKGLLAKKPYEDITVSEICEGAMVRRATFYRHFSGKDALLEFVISQERAKVDAEVDPEGVLSLPDYCQAMTARFMELIDERRNIISAQGLSPEFTQVIMLFADEIGERFADKLAKEPGYENRKTELLAYFYANGLVGAIRHAMHAGNPGAADDLLLEMRGITEQLFVTGGQSPSKG